MCLVVGNDTRQQTRMGRQKQSYSLDNSHVRNLYVFCLLEYVRVMRPGARVQQHDCRLCGQKETVFNYKTTKKSLERSVRRVIGSLPGFFEGDEVGGIG